MTGSPIYYKTTPNNQGDVVPIGRQPLIVGSPECLEMNAFLKSNDIQTFDTIFSPAKYCGREVYWLKYEKPPKDGTSEYGLVLSWFRQEMIQSNINQKGSQNG